MLDLGSLDAILRVQDGNGPKAPYGPMVILKMLAPRRHCGLSFTKLQQAIEESFDMLPPHGGLQAAAAASASISTCCFHFSSFWSAFSWAAAQSESVA